MSKESISSAAELVNSILYTKGYFQELRGEKEEEDDDFKLLFQSINSKELEERDVLENDKKVINIIYMLLQKLDKSKQERLFVNNQLKEKSESIKSQDLSIKQLEVKNDSLTRDNIHKANEIQALNQSLKALKSQIHQTEKSLQLEKNMIASIKTKYEVETKKKTLMIDKLQDKLINDRQRKIQKLSQHTSNSLDDEDEELASKKQIVFDREMESLMINLNNLITNITLQNDENIKFIQFFTNYLNLFNEFLIKKLNYTENNQHQLTLPPTPKFFMENFQLQSNSDFKRINDDDDGISAKISKIVDFEELQSNSFENLNKFYELLTNENFNVSEQNFLKYRDNDKDHDKIQQLQNEIKLLNQNLNIAIETNEKWNHRFKDLEQQRKK